MSQNAYKVQLARTTLIRAIASGKGLNSTGCRLPAI